MSAHSFYRKWARFYESETILKGVDAIVLVEGKTDKPFWEKVFHHAQKRVRLIAGSETKTRTGGKQECLKYYPFLRRRFFICIDSDYDYILQTRSAHNIRHFVVQTYAYAIENHYLAANAGLQQFLQRYSAIIYPAFLHHLSLGPRMKEFNKDFNTITAFTDMRESSLIALQKNIQKRYPNNLPITSTVTMAIDIGLCPDNTYLFIPAKILKHKLRCSDDLSFTHFPMNRILDDIRQLMADDEQSSGGNL